MTIVAGVLWVLFVWVGARGTDESGARIFTSPSYFAVVLTALLALALVGAWTSLHSRTADTTLDQMGPAGYPVQPAPVTSAPPPAPATRAVHAITNEDFPGCTDRAYFERLIRYAKAGDVVGFVSLLNRGVADGICTHFDRGEKVEVLQRDTAAGLIKVRRVGATTEYWTHEGAIK